MKKRNFASYNACIVNMRLVFASNNAHKLKEVREILCSSTKTDGNHIEVLSLKDVGFEQDIEETGATLEENSAIKAHAVWQFVCNREDIDGVFADDTGLEIEALGGAPGVYTARWAGEPANDANNRHKALQSLAGIANRKARFRTVVTLITHGMEYQVEGVVSGCIAEQESGHGGFGYDPLFVPDGYEQTFACLTETEKNSISHRGRAMRALVELLNGLH